MKFYFFCKTLCFFVVYAFCTSQHRLISDQSPSTYLHSLIKLTHHHSYTILPRSSPSLLALILLDFFLLHFLFFLAILCFRDLVVIKLYSRIVDIVSLIRVHRFSDDEFGVEFLWGLKDHTLLILWKEWNIEFLVFLSFLLVGSHFPVILLPKSNLR